LRPPSIAARILALGDPSLGDRLAVLRAEMAAAARAADAEVSGG
jgi:phosphoribosylcarboxyaminoimidazole (NCAIR) mutase